VDNNVEIRWGIIGCGNVTEFKSGPAYQKVKNFNLSAVMRRNGELARDYAMRHNVEKHYDNADELINDPSIDAIYIATPPDSHKLYALRVAAVGKPCCIEKPLAPNYQDSKDIVAAFNQANTPLFVAYYRRSLPRFNKVKSLIEEGSIGEVRHVSWHLSKPVSDIDLSGQYNWRTDKHVAPGGYFDDLASHGLDLIAYLLGDFEEVKGIGSNQQQLYSALDAVTACWRHKNGITGSGSWNFGTLSRADEVIIMGSNGDIRFSIFDECPITLRCDGKTSSFEIENPDNIQLHHVQNIREQLLEGGQHPSSGETAAHTSWVMDKMLNII